MRLQYGDWSAATAFSARHPANHLDDTYQEESKPDGDRSMQDDEPVYVLAGTLELRTAPQTGRREWCQA